MSNVDNGGYYALGQGIYEKSLYLLNFVINLKLLCKKVFKRDRRKEKTMNIWLHW